MDGKAIEQRIHEEENRQGKVITLFSALGGVGKTTIALNVAAALAQSGSKKVCLLDGDLQFGDICRFLNVVPELTSADFATQGLPAGQPVDRYLTTWRKLTILAAPLTIEQAQAVTAEVLTAAVERLRSLYDYLVVDTALGFGPEAIALIDVTDILLFIGTLDYIPSVKNMKVGLDTISGIGYPDDNVKLILNRHKSKTAINIWEAEALLEKRFITMLPNEFTTAVAAMNNNVPCVLGQPNKPLSLELNRLAQAVLSNTWGDKLPQSKLARQLSRWLE